MNGLGKAVAMNSYKNGPLRILGVKGGPESHQEFVSFITSMAISDVQHEELYGDAKLAKKMYEEDKDAREKKVHCKLTYLNLDASKFMRCLHTCFNLQKYKIGEATWPKFFEFAAVAPVDLHLRNSALVHKDCEVLQYALKTPNG